MKRTILTLLFSCLSLPVLAKEYVSLSDIEAYLNNLNTFEASFEQYTPGDDYATGKFYLNRPKQFLWQYNTPHQQKVISTGQRLFFHDPETGQTTQLPLQSGFAAILTQQPLQLNKGHFLVEDIVNDENFVIVTIHLKDATDEGPSRFILRFNQKPMQLISMSSQDNFGQGISIHFSNQKQNQQLDKNLFDFTPEVEKLNDF